MISVKLALGVSGPHCAQKLPATILTGRGCNQPAVFLGMWSGLNDVRSIVFQDISVSAMIEKIVSIVTENAARFQFFMRCGSLNKTCFYSS